MRISVNGEMREVAARSLAALLIELGYLEEKIATALNGDFVRERDRNQASLTEGDAVEIVSPRQGG